MTVLMIIYAIELGFNRPKARSTIQYNMQTFKVRLKKLSGNHIRLPHDIEPKTKRKMKIRKTDEHKNPLKTVRDLKVGLMKQAYFEKLLQ